MDSDLGEGVTSLAVGTPVFASPGDGGMHTMIGFDDHILVSTLTAEASVQVFSFTLAPW